MAVRDLKQAYGTFLESRHYEWNIVLTPNRYDTADQARTRANEFFKRMDRACLGRKWKKKTEHRVEAAYWREYADSVPHIHALARFNIPNLPGDDDLKSMMIEQWGRLDNIGRLYAERNRDLTKSISYNMKQIRTEKDFDNLFFYPWGER